MAEQDSLKCLVELMESQIALNLHARGANQNAIARILKKRKASVNDLVQGAPKGGRS